MAISNATLSLVPSNVYISSGNTVVSVMYFCNQGTATANLNVWAITAPNAIVSTNSIIYKEVQLAVADTLVIDMEKLVLSNGDQIKANTGGTISATVSYVGI